MPDGLLTIFIDTDPKHPEDLGWEIKSIPGGEIVASRPVGYYANQYKESMSEEVMVRSENFYRFTVYDRDSDGFNGEISVVRGRTKDKTGALVYEPGFSKVSGSAVAHGFYVGDNPPRELTLELKFDANPGDLAWSVTNLEGDLPLGFKWFDWYSANLKSTTEKIPIYGDDQGQQQYVFTILDLGGDGICCSQGQGSFSLYLGEPGSGTLIASGGDFTTEKTFTFDINSSGLVSTSTVLSEDPRQPSASDVEYYMAPATGICQVSDESMPTWVTSVYYDYDECCSFSWNRQPCLQAKPSEEELDLPSTTVDDPRYTSDDQSSTTNNDKPTFDIPSLADSDSTNDNGAFTHTPVTGSFTCKAAGLTCTIICNQCGSIKRVAQGMQMAYPNKSTIIYTAERGTEDYPDEPSKLILVESDTSAGNVISCDEGCTCDSVNDSVLGCGLVAKPIGPIATSPAAQPPPEYISGSVQLNSSGLIIPLLLVLTILI